MSLEGRHIPNTQKSRIDPQSTYHGEVFILTNLNFSVIDPYKSLLEKLVKTLLNAFGDRLISVVVYGSVARGDNRKDSDVDLLLVIRDLPKTMTERIVLFEKAEREIRDDMEKLMNQGYYVTFSPVMKTPEEAVRFSPLYMDMTEDAVILYDRDSFFKKKY